MALCLNRGIKLNRDKSELFEESLVHVYQIILNIICWTKALILIGLSNRNILRNKPNFYFKNDLYIIFCFYGFCNCSPNLWSVKLFAVVPSLMLEAMFGCFMVNEEINYMETDISPGVWLGLITETPICLIQIL